MFSGNSLPVRINNEFFGKEIDHNECYHSNNNIADNSCIIKNESRNGQEKNTQHSYKDRLIFKKYTGFLLVYNVDTFSY